MNDTDKNKNYKFIYLKLFESENLLFFLTSLLLLGKKYFILEL